MSYLNKVYKYRVWGTGTHKNTLLHNELYFASPKDFNDPFDCRIPIDFINITDNEKNDYINNLANKYRLETHRKGLNFEEEKSNLIKRLNDPVFLKERESIQNNKLDKYYGILALSCRWNSILMWSHYSDCHRGFCVGFWRDKLQSYLLLNKKVRGGKVKYDKCFPKIKPKIAKLDTDLLNDAYTRTHVKSDEWSYEEEYRIVQTFCPKEPKSFERIVQVPDEVFAEVILGINTTKNDCEEIIDICKQKNIPVYKAKKKDFMFEIDRELI